MNEDLKSIEDKIRIRNMMARTAEAFGMSDQEKTEEI
jgi:hypothetical protein